MSGEWSGSADFSGFGRTPPVPGPPDPNAKPGCWYNIVITLVVIAVIGGGGYLFWLFIHSLFAGLSGPP